MGYGVYVRDEVFEDIENAERSGVQLDVAVVAE